ncbi:Zinc finger MYM-type protein 1 [Glycine soja]
MLRTMIRSYESPPFSFALCFVFYLFVFLYFLFLLRFCWFLRHAPLLLHLLRCYTVLVPPSRALLASSSSKIDESRSMTFMLCSTAIMIKHPQQGTGNELINEEHEQCYKMAKIMLKVTVASEAILNTIYGEVSRSFAVRWKDVLDHFWHLLDNDGNLHTILYNQDLNRQAIVAGWTTLRDFYYMTGDHQVLLTHYEASSIGENVIEQPLIDHTDNEENFIEQPPIDNTDNGVEKSPRDDTENGENVIEQPPINNTDNTNSHNFNQELEDNILEIGVEGNVEHNNTSSEGPIRHDNFQYPKDENNRYFYSSCYQRTLSNGGKHDSRWLVYSKDLDKVYCSCCKLFGSTNVSQLANEGTKDWKNLGSKLKSHETNHEHIINMTKWIELEKRLTTKQTIDKHIQEQINKEKEHWEKVLLRIIAIVKYLSKNNLAFRGTNEKIYEKGNGNFLSLIEMLAEFDPIMQEHVRCIKSNETHNHFLSNIIQNELIEMIAFQVKKSIIEKVKDAKYFSFILDCTPDVSHQEQMTLILRCVDTSKSPIKIEEYFLEFLKVDDTSGKCLFNELVNVLKKYGLNIDDISGQGYDNGSNMKGKNQGVQRRLLDINSRAFYTSCGCHNLNLVLCDMASSSPRAISFFGVLQRIYSLFASSTKRWKILQDNVSKFSVKSLSQTRWESRIESVKAIKFQAPKILQSKDMHIDVAIDHLKGLITYLKHYRKNGFALTLESTEEMAIEMDIEPKFREKRKIHRKPHFDENISNEITHSPEESFRIEYFLYILDQSINFIETRFEQFFTMRLFLDVPSTMYYFLKDKGLTHLNLEDIAECPIVFNHKRKTTKIGVGWKYFCEIQSFKAGMEIVFKFPYPTVNYVLFWPCL